MDASSIRPTDLHPVTAPAPAAAAKEAASPRMAGDRLQRSASAGPDALSGLSASQKAWRGLGLAARMLPGAIAQSLAHPGALLSGLAAPYLHPLKSLHEANAAVKASAAQGPLEAALTAVKRHGGLLAAWGLPLSIALAPFTGGTSLIAAAAMAVGAAGVAATGVSLAKNTLDAAHAGSEAELEAQSREIADDGLGLATAAATMGAAKLMPRGVARPVAGRPPVEAATVKAAPAPQPVEAKPRTQAPVEPPPGGPAPVAEVAHPAPVAGPTRAEGIVRQALPERPRAMEQAVAEQTQFFLPHPKNYMAELLHEAGFDGLPAIATESELDQAVARGERELFRGVSDAAFADQLRDGELFIGNKNANGSGIFVAYGQDARATAARYGSGRGAVLRMALKPDAKIVTYHALEKMLKQEKAENVATTNAMREKLKADVQAAATPEEAARIRKEGQRVIDDEITRSGFRFSDIGRYAVLKGYDAIDMGSTQFMNVLNRTALRMQDTNAARFVPIAGR